MTDDPAIIGHHQPEEPTPAMPHIELAIAAQQMLAKATITGAEVPMFVNIHNWLEAIRNGHLVVSTPVPLEDEHTTAAPIAPEPQPQPPE
jgi:hypothetical protein